MSRVMSIELANVECQVVRLARAYSHDRGNMIVESTLIVQWDGPAPSISSVASTPQSSTPVPFAMDPSIPRSCLSVSSTPSKLQLMVDQLRDRDVLWLAGHTDGGGFNNQPHFATIYKTTDGHIYVSDMVMEFEKSTLFPPMALNVTTRQLLLRRLNDDIHATKADEHTVTALNLQGWADWVYYTNQSFTQVWGRTKTGSAYDPIDATVLAANGAIDTRSNIHSMTVKLSIYLFCAR
jgi:hypothetical protein